MVRTALVLLVLAVAAAMAADKARARRSRSLPADSPRAAPAHEPPKVRRAVPFTAREIARNRATAMGWFQRARKEINPSLHLAESANFLIFSTWPRAGDKRLREVCETMHSHLRKQFAMPEGRNVWAGKLPVYVFTEVEDFQRFCKMVGEADMRESGGFVVNRADGFCYIALNRTRSKTHFYGLLVHEGTHAFLARVPTGGFLPDWVNEGLAETMAAQLVPGCKAARRYVQATGQALRRDRDISGIFQQVKLEDFDYGVAQSLVRFLLSRGGRRFIELVKLLKLGTDEAEALERTYGLTHEQLVAEWRQASRKALGKRR